MVASHGTMGYSSAGAQKAKAYEYANDFCKARIGKSRPSVTGRPTIAVRVCTRHVWAWPSCVPTSVTIFHGWTTSQFY